MTFEQWYETGGPSHPLAELPKSLYEASHRDAWDAATLAERERCAKVAEAAWDKELTVWHEDGNTDVIDEKKIAAAIRAG